MTTLYEAARAATSDNAIPARPGTAEAYALVERLLAEGADPDGLGPDRMTPLHCAAWSGDVRLARILLAGGASPSVVMHGTEGATPLALACFYAQSTVARVLAEPGPEPDNLRTAACLGRPLDRFWSDGRLTAQAGVGRSFYRPFDGFPEWTPSDEPQQILDEALSWCVRHGAVDSMAWLVAHGANVNANPYRGTPLLWAIYADSVPAAAWLLDHGADPDLRHDFGGSEHGKQAVALHLAAQYSALGTLDLLLARGADPTVVDGAHGATPLDWAEHCDQPEAAARIRAALADRA